MEKNLKLFEIEPTSPEKKLKHSDWKGDGNSVFKTLPASNHTEEERKAFDYYATDPVAAEWLTELEIFSENVWECACGEGHLSKVFSEHGYNVKSTDLIDRGFGLKQDFLSIHNTDFVGDIITNAPYSKAVEFVIKGLSIIPTGYKVAMFLKITFFS